MDSGGEDEEGAIARVLRLGASPERDLDALAAELARLDATAGGEGGEGEARALFRLAQELLIHNEEQVSTLTRDLDMLRRSNASSKRRKKLQNEDSPSRSEDGYLEIISRQEEEIGANKEILDQLYADIAELEGRKQELMERDLPLDVDSNSSREPLSELNAIKQLESQLAAKNRHIRKMLTDIKVLEEENRILKKKVSVVKEKLSEATQFIESLTEQLLKSKNECTALTETIGKSEEAKNQLILEIEFLKKKLNQKDSNKTELGEEIQAKLLHWKNTARSRKTENENLLKEISKMKEASAFEKNNSHLSNIIQQQEEQIKRLQEKLSEASDEILDSVKIIEHLKHESKKKEICGGVDNTEQINMGTKSETDDTKSGLSLNKMKRKVHNLTTSLKIAEETLALREQELAELSSQLQLLESGEEGVRDLLGTLKSKRRQLKLKDVGIKSLVQEINTLSRVVDGLQTENEAMREQLNIRPDETIPTKGVLLKFFKSEKRAGIAEKKLRELQNSYVTLELSCRMKEKMVARLKDCLSESGISEHQIEGLICSSDTESEVMPKDGGGESSVVLARRKTTHSFEKKKPEISEEMKSLIDENDGLRRGMEEILNFLKDNSTTTSGTLAFQCPSLEKVVQTLDARHAAGWYAPHMAAVMGLQAAIGGRDALLTALHEARKETFEVMQQLSKQSEKSTNLELKLLEIEKKSFENPKPVVTTDNEVDFLTNGVFGTWMSTKDINEVNLKDKGNVRDIIDKGNQIHETNLKEALVYFHKQFKILYEKMTDLAIQTTNDQNKWAIDEEKFKAVIVNLEAQLEIKNGDDASENSEGLVLYSNPAVMSRQCTYLEESYRYIRTLNENIKNEFLECERQKIIMIANFESQIQLLMLNIVNLTDQLRNSVSIDLFLKQNVILNEINIKYRSILDKNTASVSCLFQNEVEKHKKDILEILANSRIEVNENEGTSIQRNLLNSTEKSVVRMQLENILQKYDHMLERSNELENINIALQSSQQQLIDSSLSLVTKEEYEATKSQLDKLVEQNKSLKDQCLHIGNQLDIALLQDTQQRHLMNDMEINMLRHQVLDLQATGDSKAIIARLSGEILIAHLQTTDIGKKIDKLTSDLAKEKQRTVEAEEMLGSREKIFNIYAARFESRFRYMFEVMQILRNQYGGTLPMVSVENYLNSMEDLSRKNQAVDEKLSEIEDLQSNLQTKTNIFREFIENRQLNCPVSELKCPHDIKLDISELVHKREIDHCNKKIEVLERSREDVSKRCESLEKTLVLVNQGFDKEPLPNIAERKMAEMEQTTPLKIEDMIHSDHEEDNYSQGSLTITLTQPQILKDKRFSIGANHETFTHASEEMPDLPGSPLKLISTNKQIKETTTAVAQTDLGSILTKTKMIQTDSDISFINLKDELIALKSENATKEKELSAALSLASKRAEESINFETSKVILETNVSSLKENIKKKELIINTLKTNLDEIKQQLNSLKYEEDVEQKRKKESSNEETKSLLKAVKKLEEDKNKVIEEYKELLQNEREEYFSNIKVYQAKIDDLQEKLDLNNLNPVMEKDDINPVAAKLSEKLAAFEDKCFKLQSTLSGYKTDLKSCENELERWKALASERLTKIEQMTGQFEERHSYELESYRAESQHWLSELAENQKETLDLRSRLAEQRTIFLKQLTEKDAHIEQHKSAAQNLKTQILSMQSMMSASDPSFDLSAIAEVSETSDASPRGSDRLEIRFHSTQDLGDPAEDSKEPSVLSPTWQETLVDRLRREKQLVGKQNALLRRQIKALAGRERRSRLEAQNLKTQMYRLTSSGSKLASMDAATISLHNKLAGLQAQLLSARRDSHAAGVTAWDKWKRSQQMAERWHSKYEEKCEELRKAESALHTARSAVARLEREKRVLLSRLGEIRSEKQLSLVKETERSNDAPESQRSERAPPPPAPAHVTAQALMERVEAQQRRIAALELADKGHEPLVTEYEKLMAQNTMLKGQVLKLESQLLESQLVAGTSGLSQDSARHGELEHLRSYCAALKEENVQLSAKLCSLTAADVGSHSSAAHRINDLEQTVLTLRGLVSKLQAEQKKSSILRGDSLRPGSGRSASEYEVGGGGSAGGNAPEWCRAELGRLRRAAAEKDSLLERSRDLLKMAAEREEELLKEVTFLRQCMDGTTKN